MEMKGFKLCADVLTFHLFFFVFHFSPFFSFKNLRFFAFLIVFFCLSLCSFSLFFLWGEGGRPRHARHGRSQHQSFRVCEVNLATPKVATSHSTPEDFVVELRRARSPPETMCGTMFCLGNELREGPTVASADALRRTEGGAGRAQASAAG